MDFQVSSARVITDSSILAGLQQQGDAVDASDPSDCLSPLAWTLALDPAGPALVGGLAPALPVIRRVTPAAEAGAFTPTTFRLDLDRALTAGAGYTLGLAPLTRSAYGAPTNPAAVGFAGKVTSGIASQIVGALAGDVVMPLDAGPDGDLRVEDRMAALRRRVFLLASAPRGTFTHAPTFGRGIVPKRTYTPAQLGQEAASLKSQLLSDPDVKAADVRFSLIDGGIVRFDVSVVPSFSSNPLPVSGTIQAGSQA